MRRRIGRFRPRPAIAPDPVGFVGGIVDKLVRPLPEAAFKVGESITEIGAFYLAHVLQLTDYLDQTHITKLGFTFFFGDPQGPLQNRPEFGRSTYPSVIGTVRPTT